jgi:hypothetical protein
MPTLTSTGVQPNATKAMAISSPVALTGAFTFYAIGIRAAGQAWFPVAKGGGIDSCIAVWTDNNVYFINDAIGVANAAFNPTGTYLFRMTRDAGNVVKAKATGVAEVTVGTLSGTFTVNYLMGRQGLDYSNTACRFRNLHLKTSLSSASEMAGIDQWFLTNYGVGW